MNNPDLEVEIGVSQLRMARELARIESRMVATARRSEQAFQRSNGRIATDFERVSRAAANVGRSSGRVGAQVQNAAFQVGDFAVQVAAGTAASRALALQLPQLLGAFGVFGAVAGAAVAILAPLA